MDNGITIVVMSGYADGKSYLFDFSADQAPQTPTRQISIGRTDDNDISLNKDAFVSRSHAKLSWQAHQWVLQDCDSTNGTFIEDPDDIMKDQRVETTVLLELGQMFRVGRTWMRIQSVETETQSDSD